MEPFGFLMCGGRQWQQVHHRRRLTGWGVGGGGRKGYRASTRKRPLPPMRVETPGFWSLENLK